MVWCLKDKNTSLGVRQDEVGSDPAADHSLSYGVGKVYCHLGSEIMFYTACVFFYSNKRK